MNIIPLIIAGMHRSGTSLITQWLQKCGLNIGDNLMVANAGNEQGYFEDMDFVQLHESLLLQNSLPDTGITDTSVINLSFTDKEKIISLLDKKNLQHTQWGWKDPRTCLFLNIYRELLPGAKYLVIYRDCNFCVYSLINRMLRDEKTKYLETGEENSYFFWKWKLYKKAETLKRFLKTYAEEFIKVWIHYNKEILYHIELLGKEHFIVVDYHNLLSNDKNVFNFLINDWNFNFKYQSFNEVYNKKLMNKKALTSRYIKNKNLLSVVSDLESKLKAYSFR